ncbi:MAG: hypothetical protein IPK71_05910 [Myxococcales bacterium]|nr:hypothetical protein [Myxococcales bacterium]
MRRSGAESPVRGALRAESPLRPLVCDGMGAVEKAHHAYFDPAIRAHFADSLDIDAGLKKGHDQENRWDYLLGHAPSGQVVAVEPHSARQDEVTTIIKKRAAARAQLRGHLRDGVKIAKWLWVASGDVQFAAVERAKLMLDQNGIEFVGKRVMAKHLPAEPTPVKRTGKKGQKRRT